MWEEFGYRNATYLAIRYEKTQYGHRVREGDVDYLAYLKKNPIFQVQCVTSGSCKRKLLQSRRQHLMPTYIV